MESGVGDERGPGSGALQHGIGRRSRAVHQIDPARTDRGENTLDQPFVPGSPKVEASTFQGVVERTREFDAGVRWWPAGGVDLALSAGYRWVDDAAHVPGARDRSARAAFEVRLTR